METTALPPMTLWQFYAELLVQTAMGVLFCWILYQLGGRDPKLGWKPSKLVYWFQEKILFILIFAAAIASFELLPKLYNSFINDVSEAAANAVVDSAGAAIDGTLETPDAQELKDMVANVVWGEMDPWQHESLVLMSAFWLFFGWCCYLASFCASPVNFFIKLVKTLGYCCLSSAMILLPMCIHRFTWEEFETPFYFLVIAAICIVVTHSWTRKMPPPLPPDTTTPPSA